MQFDRSGAFYEASFFKRGAWEIRVPWQVAIDNFQRETGRTTSDEAELKTWFSDNEPNFTAYVFALEGIYGRPSWDDPRITYKRVRDAESDDD